MTTSPTRKLLARSARPQTPIAPQPVGSLPDEAARVAADLQRQRGELVEAARQQGLADAQREVADLRAKLEQEAARQLAQRRQELERTFAGPTEKAQELVRKLEAMLADAPDQILAQALDLAHAGLAHVLQAELSAQDRVRLSIEHALHAARPLKAGSGHLNPADLSELQALGISTGEDLAWFSDPHLPRGACRLDTGKGEIQSRMDERFAALHALWRDAVIPPQGEKE